MTNTFFGTKISFLNDMKLLGNKCGVIWEDGVRGFVRDGRVGHSHLNVKVMMVSLVLVVVVFQKTYEGLINFGENRGVDMNVLKETG